MAVDIAGTNIGQHTRFKITNLYESCDFVQLALCDDRAKAAILLEGVANLDALCSLLQAHVEHVGDGLMHQ